MNLLPSLNKTTSMIDGCRKNDLRQQELLYQAYAPSMFALCLRYSGTRDEAEDILQTGFIKVFSKISTYKNQGPFEAWIRKIMVNTAIEYYRRKKRSVITEELNEKYNAVSILPGSSSLDVKRLLNLIQQLPSMYRNVFTLYAIDGYSHKEISEMLSISELASRANLCRAREVLKKIILKTEIKERECLAC